MDELMPGPHEPVREYLREDVVSRTKKNWLMAVLAVLVLGIGIGIAIATHTTFLFVAIAVLFALFTTYFVGRLDKPGGDG